MNTRLFHFPLLALFLWPPAVNCDIIDNITSSSSADRDDGNKECPCIGALDSPVADGNCMFGDEPGISVLGRCYPNSYGALGCRAYDMFTLPECLDRDLVPPGWCANRFCYVDSAKCRNSFEHYYQSKLFPGRYYSYSTCGSSADDWLISETIDSLSNMSLTAALPGVLWPNHYKTDDSGENLILPESPQAYNNSIPWTGYMIDYFKAVVRVSNIRDVRFVHRSKGSQTKGYSGTFTQAVTDVEAGITDIAVSSYWVTAEWLSLTRFTVPFATDAIKLWVPYHGRSEAGGQDASFKENFLKLSQPFSDGLWAAIGITILAFAILSVIVSPKTYRKFNKPAVSLSHKIKRGLVIMSDALSVSALDFLGGGLNAQEASNLPQKWLNLGFALVIFIAVSAYTANLAAFLTIQAASGHLSSMEEAIAANIPLCASTVLKAELKILYPTAQWVFRPEFHLLQEAYDQGVCGGVVQGWMEIRADPRSQVWYCERGLIRVGNTILDKPMAFPANQQIVAGLSHWIVQAQTRGIFFENYATQIEAMCPLDITMIEEDMDVDSDLNQLTIKNMAVPLTVFACCCAVALAIHLARYFIKGKPETMHEADKDCTQTSHPSFSSECSQGGGKQPITKPFQSNRSKEVSPYHEIQSVESAEQAMQNLMASQWALFRHMHELSASGRNGNKGTILGTTTQKATTDRAVISGIRARPRPRAHQPVSSLQIGGALEDRNLPGANQINEEKPTSGSPEREARQRLPTRHKHIQRDDSWWQRSAADMETESRVLDVLLTTDGEGRPNGPDLFDG